MWQNLKSLIFLICLFTLNKQFKIIDAFLKKDGHTYMSHGKPENHGFIPFVMPCPNQFKAVVAQVFDFAIFVYKITCWFIWVGLLGIARQTPHK